MRRRRLEAQKNNTFILQAEVVDMFDDDRSAESVTMFPNQLLYGTSKSWKLHVPRLPYAILQSLCQSISVGSALEGLAYLKYGAHLVFFLHIRHRISAVRGSVHNLCGAIEAGWRNVEVVNAEVSESG